MMSCYVVQMLRKLVAVEAWAVYAWYHFAHAVVQVHLNLTCAVEELTVAYVTLASGRSASHMPHQQHSCCLLASCLLVACDATQPL